MKLSFLSIGLCTALCALPLEAATERQAPELAVSTAVQNGVELAQLATYTRALAFDLAAQWNDPQFRSLVASRITAEQKHAPLVTLLRDYADTWPSARTRALAETTALLDRELREAKGIAAYLNELLEVRLATPIAASGLAADGGVLFVAPPAGNDRLIKVVEAFDAAGRSVMLDARQAPQRTVLVVNIDERGDLHAGVQVINDGLRAAGLQPATPDVTTVDPVQTSKLMQISATNDQEPWVKGAAEMYALVAGVDPQLNKASIAAVDMPYFDHDNTQYYPNQVVIYWSNYRYFAADMIFYEHDSGYNYTQIVQIIISTIGTFVPDYQWATNLASQVIAAMPADWLSDDDDYVDCFYTLERGVTYTNRWGASSNIRMSLQPYTLYP